MTRGGRLLECREVRKSLSFKRLMTTPSRDQQQVRAFNEDATGNIFMGATAGKVAFLTFRQLALSATPSRSNEFARVVLPNLAARLRFRRRTRCT